MWEKHSIGLKPVLNRSDSDSAEYCVTSNPLHLRGPLMLKVPSTKNLAVHVEASAT